MSDSIDDFETAKRVRRICEGAADIAKNVSDGTGDSSVIVRYEQAAEAAMHLVLKISDDLVRDQAVRQLIELCVKANSVRTAEILLRGIRAESIREGVLSDNPVLRQVR
jgi:pyridoxal biosynthesis lyase PdxS